ncbi:MAG: hypothetical protein M5U12_31160 [Verrucomicrobia bacterium]|nr:hypothetical protein [Verrucomicrobiota bacterium]
MWSPLHTATCRHVPRRHAQGNRATRQIRAGLHTLTHAALFRELAADNFTFRAEAIAPRVDPAQTGGRFR